jgi:hypothetical protein
MWTSKASLCAANCYQSRRTTPQIATQKDQVHALGMASTATSEAVRLSSQVRALRACWIARAARK